MKSKNYVPVLVVFFLNFYHQTFGNEFDRNNITILHEVENDPLELNTHEVLPSKSIKKKPYAILDKSSEYVKIPVVKAYNGHAVAFDFNLGDLEDVHDAILPNGDLSSEERHLLRNTNDEDLTYSEEPLITPSVVSTYVTPMSTESYFSTSSISPLTDRTTTTTSSTTSTSSSPSSFTHLSSTEATTPIVMPISTDKTLTAPSTSGDPVSPHIFKILSKNKSKIKGGHEYYLKDEQQKTFGNHFNSISTFFGDTDENSTADALRSHINVFQLMVNLYDHFFWQPSELKTKVSSACAMDINAYLSALNSNYEWAQKAYDSSGHYRGQLFFGSNKWLGQRQCCIEINQQEFQDDRKHFEFEFYVATVHIAAWAPYNLTAELQLGECLPKSCTPRDVESILKFDPHAQMLTSGLIPNNNTHINIKSVRAIPGRYCLWKDPKFVFFFTFCMGLVGVCLLATCYESNLNEKKRIRQITNSVKVDPKIGVNPDLNGKTYEIYQMTKISTKIDNNNVDIEADLKKNNKQDKKHQAAIQPEGKQEAIQGNEGVIAKQACSDVNANHVELSAGGMMKKTELGIQRDILLCFAFQSNASTILSMEQKVENQTSCVHGLRVLSVLWTILVHTYLEMMVIGENRFLRIITERNFFYQFIGNATFSVDTFFFISGFLVTLLFLRQDKNKQTKHTKDDGFLKKSLNKSFLIVIYRYIRLTPAYLFVILFYELSLKYTFDRSVFQPLYPVENCADYWWRNIMYINNFFPLNQMCMVWSWYMANDMQFYIMTTLLLVFSTRYFKTTILILLTCLVSSWGVSGMISIHYNYTHKVANPFESFNFLYDKPWQRVGSYIVGMIAGFIVHVNKTPPKISFRTNLLLWFASLGLLFVVICGVWSGQLSVIATAFYVSIGHTAFAVALVWIVLSCCWGLANPVNKVLSYPGLLPLSRLTYCTYLVHPVVILLTSFQMDGTIHLNNFMIWVIFLGNAVVSFGVAFFVSVLFEAPVVRLLKIFFKK
ncbi:uncharacterized protein LOC129910468 [Episyrphus balteatus]|uniref:uncharacterized protein LOC129910468 n=1 Tax=Episyrphus balteatus TaxID=286459 RepID=UPI002486C560|nr:uncharacterized protein LOC129910468 [Episyrphus balteatus]XP_055843842.1 uncharacterized protein LOC129910468 [Episyrphus balteatus]